MPCRLAITSEAGEELLVDEIVTGPPGKSMELRPIMTATCPLIYFMRCPSGLTWRRQRLALWGDYVSICVTTNIVLRG